MFDEEYLFRVEGDYDGVNVMNVFFPIIVKNGDLEERAYALFDTGATNCVITRDLYDKLEVKSAQVSTVSTFTDRNMIKLFSIDIIIEDINGSRYCVNKIKCSCPIIDTLEFQEDEAVLGLSFIRKFNWTICFENDKVILTAYNKR